MSDNGSYLSIAEARTRLRQATQIVLDAEKAYEGAVQTAADGEANYRLQLGAAFKRQREGGAGVEESNVTARAEVVVHSRERDASAGAARLALERLENARDSRRSLWRLVEWSARHDAPIGRAREDVPGSEWP